MTLAGPAPVPIDARAQFRDARGKRVSLRAFQQLLEEGTGVRVLAEYNRFGHGIVRLEVHDPKQRKPIREHERIYQASEVSLLDGDGQSVLVIAPPDAILVPAGTPIIGDGADLAGLVGERVIVEGELIGETRTARSVLVLASIDGIDLQVEVGDFDGEGIENDISVGIYDQADAELVVPVRVALDRLPPEEATSGQVMYNLTPGKHTVSVDVPSAPGLSAEEKVIIRARESKLQVVSTTPQDQATGVSTTTDLRITFSSRIQQMGEFVNMVALLRPGAGSGRLKEMRLEEDGYAVALPVELQDGVTYTLSIVSAVGEGNDALTRPVSIMFSTGGTVEARGAIAGQVTLVPRAANQGQLVEIISGEVIAVDEDGRQAGRGAVETDGSFEISGLPEGSLKLFGNLETTAGRATGSHDADGDGAPDMVQVIGGQTVSGIGIEVVEPLIEEPPPPDDPVPDASSPVSVDLDPATGDQGLTLLQGEPGAEIRAAVYLDGAEDLFGFDLLVEYDPTAMALLGVEEATEGEPSILKLNGGFSFGIVRPLGASVNWSSVLLAPTDDQLAQGKGLLGELRFKLKEGFIGTTELVVSQLVLESAQGTSTQQPFVRVQIDGEGVTKQITVTSDKDLIEPDGTDQAVLAARIYDLDGIPLTDDSTSELTFQVVEGEGLVNGSASAAVTVSAGEASAVLTATGEGTIQVRVTTEGASSAMVEIAVDELPPIGAGPVGPVALDLDTADGDQGLRQTATPPNPGDTVVIDLVATEGVLDAIAFEAVLQFNSAHLAFKEVILVDLFDGGLPIPLLEPGGTRVNAVLVNAKVSSSSGSVARISFDVLEGFPGETRVTLTSLQIAFPDQLQSPEIGAGGAAVLIGGTPTDGPSADADGDGIVGFTDFVVFAQAFGSAQGDDNFRAQLDLDGDGKIGFGDFVKFAQVFGKKVDKPASLGKPVVPVQGANDGARVSLAAIGGETPEEAVLAVHLTDAVDVQGYSVRVTYNASALELLEVSSELSSRFADSEEQHTVALQVSPNPGEVLLADMLLPDAALEGEGDLARLAFRILDESELGRVAVTELLLSDGVGGINQLAGAYLGDLGGIPTEYGLSRNSPNPFNPETQIAYQLPEAGKVWLAVYNLLGQNVRTLVHGPQDAGTYQLTWDGRDASGRAVASGVYLYRLEAGDYVAVRKMLLIK